MSWVSNVIPVETNIVLFDTVEPAAIILTKLADKGIKASDTGKNRIRFVTHLDVHPAQIAWAVNVLRQES